MERKKKKVADVPSIVEDVTIMGDVENNITNSGELKLENISPGRQGKEAREVDSQSEIEVFPAHLDLEVGNVISIIDNNFGVIKHSSSGHEVLFDTCDLWVTKDTTAAQSKRHLSSVVDVGSMVKFHAVLVQTSSQPRYLATAAWQVVEGVPTFSDDLAPGVIGKDAIHKDKIEIFNTVTRIYALKMGASTSQHRSKVDAELQFQGLRSFEEVQNGKGHLASILNSSFGLIQSGASFCLFDTYDLFLEGGKTAAQSRLTVTNCLTVGMEVTLFSVYSPTKPMSSC